MQQVFEFHKGTDLLKNKIEAMDVHKRTVYYGDKKGMVYASQLVAHENSFSLVEIGMTKVSKNKVEKIEAWPFAKVIAVLSGGRIDFLNPEKIEDKSNFYKSGVTHMAINPQHDLALALGKKLHFFSYDQTKEKFVPFAFEVKVKEISFSEIPSKIVWNNDVLGIILKSTYVILGPRKNIRLDLCPIGKALYPHLTVYKDQWIAVVGDNICFFEKFKDPIPGRVIPVRATSKAPALHSITVKEKFLLVVKDIGMSIYNLLDCSPIQEISFDKSWTFRDLACDEHNVYLAMDTAIGHKKDVASCLMYLIGVPLDIQIRRLIEDSKAQDAINIFSQNVFQAEENYEMRKELLNIEIGWVFFKNFDFLKAEEFFLQVNFDPREFLVLIPEILSEKPERGIFLKKLIENPLGKISPKEGSFKEGIETIIALIEAKRAYIVEHYDLNKDFTKKMHFCYPENPKTPKPQ